MKTSISVMIVLIILNPPLNPPLILGKLNNGIVLTFLVAALVKRNLKYNNKIDIGIGKTTPEFIPDVFRQLKECKLKPHLFNAAIASANYNLFPEIILRSTKT